MLCPVCQAPFPDDAEFCHRCGENPLDDEARDANEASSAFAEAEEPVARRSEAHLEEAFDEIWEAVYSPLAMGAAWLFCLTLSAAVLTLGWRFLPRDRAVWTIVLAGLAIVWLTELGKLFWRRISIRYSLTQDTLRRDAGALNVVRESLALDAIHRVDCEQAALDRLLRVGDVRVTARDGRRMLLRGVANPRSVVRRIDGLRLGADERGDGPESPTPAHRRSATGSSSESTK